MDISHFNQFFKTVDSSSVLHNPFVTELLSTYNYISISTLRRWLRDGRQLTYEKKYRYCKTCGKQFYAKTSVQITCSPKCAKIHKRELARMNYTGKKYQPLSYAVKTKRRMNRRVSAKLSTRRHCRYTKQEIEAVRNYSKTAYQVALEIGRSSASVERARMVYKKT